MRSATIAIVLSVVVAGAANAQSVTLTEEDGRPITIGTPATYGSQLRPSELSSQAIVDEFQRICLPDPAGAATRIDGSIFDLEGDDAVFAPEGRRGEARISQWRGSSAVIAIWAGEDANLRGLPIAINQRAYSTTSRYGPFSAAGTQCNLVIALPNFAAASELADRLSSEFGEPGQLVVRRTFADGHWTVATDPSLRINFTAPTSRAGPQPVHLSAQTIR